ncbi:Serine--tRNA ligase [Grifola frondosa]|uniref:serine--tRNA ligase n=1 Tax=Grifola frondosa TaxID=5627 RepID=A0A1C7LVZ8_GRIFR|nr:Serine--tRNA ligase [Grifola frondosa]
MAPVYHSLQRAGLVSRICARVRRYSSGPERPQTSTALPKPRLDYRDISENVVYKSHNAFNRKVLLPVGSVQSVARLYEQQKELSQSLNAQRHSRSVIGERIRAASQDTALKQAALEDAKKLKAKIAELELQVAEVEEQLFKLAIAIPNDTHPLSPIGPESVAETLSSHGPPPLPASTSRDHVSICNALDLLDLKAGATVTGSSWYYLKNEGALLELALVSYALSIAIKHGFTPVTTPDVVRADIARRCGFQPRDPLEDPATSQMYHIDGSSEAPVTPHHHPGLVLAGTAEIPLAGMFANHILPSERLPIKVVGLGHAFRAEAGARGADTRGLYRVHQFTKLELFAITKAEGSEEMMEHLRRLQMEIFEGLDIPFRVLDMPTEELGASAYRKYDAEAWMPGRGGWGEISSTSNCTDYQARRLHIRYQRSSASSADSPSSEQSAPAPLPFAHTLNGTAAAIPRLIVALLENGARFDDFGAVLSFIHWLSVLMTYFQPPRWKFLTRSRSYHGPGEFTHFYTGENNLDHVYGVLSPQQTMVVYSRNPGGMKTAGSMLECHTPRASLGFTKVTQFAILVAATRPSHHAWKFQALSGPAAMTSRSNSV